MTMGSKESLGLKGPHRGVEATVTQGLLPLKGNVFIPGHSSQLSAKTRSKNPGYSVPFLPARKHKHFQPKTQPPSPGKSPGHKATGSDLLLVLRLLHFWLCCSSSSGRCIEADSSRIPSCWGEQQPSVLSGCWESQSHAFSATRLLQ